MTSQVIYVTNYISDGSDRKSLKSVKFCLSETDVTFRLPKLCILDDSTCAVINGFIYVLDVCWGDMNRLET